MDRQKLKERSSWIMRSIHVPPDQVEGQYELYHGEIDEDAILLRTARKYKRQLYNNTIIFFTRCSIDPEARPTVLKYRAEYGPHAYKKNWQRDAKNCWRNRSLDFIVNKSTALFRATHIFQKDSDCVVGYG